MEKDTTAPRVARKNSNAIVRSSLNNFTFPRISLIKSARCLLPELCVEVCGEETALSGFPMFSAASLIQNNLVLVCIEGKISRNRAKKLER